MCTYQFLRKSYICVNLVKFQQEFGVITNSLLSMFSVTKFDCISKPNENFSHILYYSAYGQIATSIFVITMLQFYYIKCNLTLLLCLNCPIHISFVYMMVEADGRRL